MSDSSENEVCVAELLKLAGINDHYSDLSEDEKYKFSWKNLEDPRIYQQPMLENLNCLKEYDFPTGPWIEVIV